MERKQENRTTLVRKEDVQRKWYILDASGKTLGHFCAEVAKILRGKHKVAFTPHIDTGDGVIVVNADKIQVTGAKEAQKIYRYYTGYIGGMREIPFKIMRGKNSPYIIWNGVKGMMPKSRLGKQQLRKLRIFKNEEHPFVAQNPVKVEI